MSEKFSSGTKKPQTNKTNKRTEGKKRCKVLALTIQSLLRFLDGRCHRPLPLFPFWAPSAVPSWPSPCFLNICRLPLLRLFVTPSELSTLFVFPFLNGRNPAFILFHWSFSWPQTDSKIDKKSPKQCLHFGVPLLVVKIADCNGKVTVGFYIYTELRFEGQSIRRTNHHNRGWIIAHRSYITCLQTMCIHMWLPHPLELFVQVRRNTSVFSASMPYT